MHFPPGKSTAVQANAPYNNIGERFLLIFQKKTLFFLAQYKCFVDICDKQTIPVTYKVTEE
ncbi:hypothetical protein HMPREF1016_00256 [Bacteroides eggerthii 1_2_48FAA]|uniref:Uncharacterized protein n=1 Tax=Bacteroides eggerthii 1_2_48FAA TaxID=665953 RepID=E5WUE2_9BACE|nr:hypothetical protein HMPREF1016_00256 [Bacteroides eggerthii 1_2_48FAA]